MLYTKLITFTSQILGEMAGCLFNISQHTWQPQHHQSLPPVPTWYGWHTRSSLTDFYSSSHFHLPQGTQRLCSLLWMYKYDTQNHIWSNSLLSGELHKSSWIHYESLIQYTPWNKNQILSVNSKRQSKKYQVSIHG